MSPLTRRLLHKHHHESWGIFDGDVQVGSISSGTGTAGKPIWRWSCGFYPGCDKRQQSAGTQGTYDEARADLKKAWDRLYPQITPEMRLEWLNHQAWTTWKYAMHAAGCQMPTQSETGRSRCFCGAEVTAETAPDHVNAKHMKSPIQPKAEPG